MLDLAQEPHFIIALAIIVGVLSVARTARLIVFDDFPPMIWARARILARFKEGSKWASILECPFCLSPYLTAGMIAWAMVSDLHWTWWVINGWWAASYVAATYVAYDEGVE
jgi:hypothetical protein